MNTLLPGLRVSEGHVNQSSETTKFRNHQERKCGKAITIVLGWQKSLFGGCKMLYSHRHKEQYVFSSWLIRAKFVFVYSKRKSSSKLRRILKSPLAITLPVRKALCNVVSPCMICVSNSALSFIVTCGSKFFGCL